MGLLTPQYTKSQEIMPEKNQPQERSPEHMPRKKSSKRAAPSKSAPRKSPQKKSPQRQQEPQQEPQQQEPQQQAPEDEYSEGQEDSVFNTAYEMILARLYDQKDADTVVDVAKSQGAMPMLVNMAYDLAAWADEQTQGQVKDEDLMSLGALALGEILGIAEKAGVEIGSSAVADGLKSMTLRYLEENGADPSELQAAMDQINPQQFEQLASAATNGGEQHG